MPLIRARDPATGLGSLHLLAMTLLSPAAVSGEPPPDQGAGVARGESIAIEVLVSPHVKSIDLAGHYPLAELRMNHEGWVQVGFMVDASGKPFEVTVVDSTGNKAFEAAAVQAVEHAKLEPGKLNGQPIESATQMKFKYSLDSTQGASRQFIAGYRHLISAIKANDRMAADAAMKELEVTNLYEDAYFGLANYQYARLWADEPTQLKYLIRAVAEEHTAQYLPTREFSYALVQIIRLQINARYFGEALKSWDDLQKVTGDSSLKGQIKPAIDQLKKIRSDDSEYEVPGSMPDGSWNLSLFKKHFRAKVTDGHISDVKLRCEKGFVRFAFDSALQYTVAAKYGECSLELEGDRETRFTLTQF